VNNWKVIFATVLIFGAGVITGGLLVNYVQQPFFKPVRTRPVAKVQAQPASTNQPVRAGDNPKPRPPEILSKQFLQQLDEALALKPGQREAVEKIIGEGQNQIRKAVQDARLEIRAVLTPEQQKQFDELIKRPLRKPASNTNGPVNVPALTNAAPTNTLAK
jgi:hypothetical protein